MKTAQRLILFLVKHYLFWLCVFAFNRLVFLLWNMEELKGAGFTEVFTAFPKAIYLDSAMICYLLSIPFLFVILSSLTQRAVFLKINLWLHGLLLACVFLITLAELPIYDEWHTKLNYKALWFLGNPSEVFHTASWVQLLGGFGGTAILVWIALYMYKRFVDLKSLPERKPLWAPALVFITIPVVLIIGLRGGLQQIPIGVSDAYYSRFNVLNLAAANSVFNLISSCLENSRADEPYNFMASDAAQKVFGEMHNIPKDSTVKVLTTSRPNVVLVVLESWSADLVKSCGGYDSITPYFEKMSSEGILFSDCYASGSLSDQGMAAVFSAFPAQPKSSVITQPSKYEHIPCINKNLKKAGYTTSFMFGGQLSYGNIRSYMYFNEFDRIEEGEDFSDDIPQGKLGVADEYLFARQLSNLRNEKQPFFASMFTLSSHGPFDFPMKHELNWGGKEKDYINSVLYVDRCIEKFIESAKKESWYSNTLFIFVSDHSHNSPRNWAAFQPEYRRIPLLFFGPVIADEFRGKNFDFTSSQTDLARTLLNQLEIDSKEFHYSKDLFNPYTPHFAYYATEEGFGFVEDGRYITWAVDGRTQFKKFNTAADSTELLQKGQSFLQVVMDEYWSW